MHGTIFFLSYDLFVGLRQIFSPFHEISSNRGFKNCLLSCICFKTCLEIGRWVELLVQGDPMVHARFVVHEVGVHVEADGQGPVLDQRQTHQGLVTGAVVS